MNRTLAALCLALCACSTTAPDLPSSAAGGKLDLPFSDESIQLLPVELPEAVSAWVNLMPDFECSWADVSAFDYSWDDPDTIPHVDGAYWSSLFAFKKIFAVTWIDEWNLVPDAGPEGLEAFLDQITTTATLESFEEAAGLVPDDYQLARIDFEFDCAPSVTCFGSAYLFLDHDQRRVYAVNFGDADEC